MTLADLLPDGMSLEDMLVIMSSLSVLVSVLEVRFAFLHRDVAAQRARLIADQRRELRSSVMGRSEEHTSALQSLMRNSYSVFCSKNPTQAPHLQRHATTH